MSEHETPKKDATDFEAAQAIVTILRNRDKGEQERILRWVSESLLLPSSGVRSPSVLPPSIPSDPSTKESPQTRTADITSFVTEKQPKSDQQFATVTAYFYRFVVAEDSLKNAITSEDLQTAGRQARGYGFKTPSTTLNNAVSAGYLDKAGRGKYRINAVGENLVAMALPGGSDETSSNRTRRKTRKAKAPSTGKKKVKSRQRKAMTPSTGKKKAKRSQSSKSK
ncbi:MAG: hypothetical protein IID34_06050 [Planctomycetes bacterium]|nr:hypothetical protein [Planctomycetota bacterium]